jgi:hypothetical protein
MGKGIASGLLGTTWQGDSSKGTNVATVALWYVESRVLKLISSFRANINSHGSKGILIKL